MGKNEETCEACHGTGGTRGDCFVCGGTGRILTTNRGRDKEEVCPMCHGTGHPQCTWCHGTGKRS